MRKKILGTAKGFSSRAAYLISPSTQTQIRSVHFAGSGGPAGHGVVLADWLSRSVPAEPHTHISGEDGGILDQ